MFLSSLAVKKASLWTELVTIGVVLFLLFGSSVLASSTNLSLSLSLILGSSMTLHFTYYIILYYIILLCYIMSYHMILWTCSPLPLELCDCAECRSPVPPLNLDRGRFSEVQQRGMHRGRGQPGNACSPLPALLESGKSLPLGLEDSRIEKARIIQHSLDQVVHLPNCPLQL